MTIKGPMDIDEILRILEMDPAEVREKLKRDLIDQLDRDRQVFEGTSFNDLLQKTYRQGADQLVQNDAFMESIAGLGIEPKHGR